MKTTAKKQDAERRYSFEEYLKHFTPQITDDREVGDDPEEIGRQMAAEALREMKNRLAKHLTKK